MTTFLNVNHEKGAMPCLDFSPLFSILNCRKMAYIIGERLVRERSYLKGYISLFDYLIMQYISTTIIG